MTTQGIAGTNKARAVTESARGSVKSASQVILLSAPLAANKTTGMFLTPYLWRPLTIVALVLMDTAALILGLMLACYVIDGESAFGEVMRFAPAVLVTWFAVLVLHGFYGCTPRRRDSETLLRGTAWGAGLVAAGLIMYPQSAFHLQEILLGALFVILLDGGSRLLYEWKVAPLHLRNSGRTPTLIVGPDEERARVRLAVESSSAYACAGEIRVGSAIDLPLLRQALDQTGVKDIILCGTERLSDEQTLTLLRSMRLRKVQVKVVPDTAALMSIKCIVSRDMSLPLLEVGCPRLDGPQRVLKRLLDLAGSVGGFIVLSPVFLVVAALIKLTSSGPVLFRQQRVGADGKVFTCYKFRSMYEDAERRQAELEALNEADGAIFKLKDDPRITPVGQYIRRWSIDELPQLINVLKGEMSLVGPRPLPMRDFELMNEHHKRRLGAVPGVTGYWQISGRSDVSFEEMVGLDLYYIENWLLSLDIKILLKTLKVVLRRDGAY